MKIPAKVGKLLEPCKHVEPHVKKLFLPLVELAVKQHEEIKRLENEVKRLKQPTLFVSPYPEGEHMSKSLISEPEQPKETTAQWIERLRKEGQLDSDAFLRFLRWKKWKLGDALEYSQKELSKINEK